MAEIIPRYPRRTKVRFRGGEEVALSVRDVTVHTEGEFAGVISYTLATPSGGQCYAEEQELERWEEPTTPIDARLVLALSNFAEAVDALPMYDDNEEPVSYNDTEQYILFAIRSLYGDLAMRMGYSSKQALLDGLKRRAYERGR